MRTLVVVIALLAPMALAAPAGALTFTVNQTGDQNDLNVGFTACDVDPGAPGDQCTFRAAIQQSNASAGVLDERRLPPRSGGRHDHRRHVLGPRGHRQGDRRRLDGVRRRHGSMRRSGDAARRDVPADRQRQHRASAGSRSAAPEPRSRSAASRTSRSPTAGSGSRPTGRTLASNSVGITTTGDSGTFRRRRQPLRRHGPRDRDPRWRREQRVVESLRVPPRWVAEQQPVDPRRHRGGHREHPTRHRDPVRRRDGQHDRRRRDRAHPVRRDVQPHRRDDEHRRGEHPPLARPRSGRHPRAVRRAWSSRGTTSASRSPAAASSTAPPRRSSSVTQRP